MDYLEDSSNSYEVIFKTMRRLRSNSDLNSPQEYYNVFLERLQRPPDWMDVKRWKALIAPFKGGRLIDLGCLDSMVPFIAKTRYPDCEVWGLDQSVEVIEKLAEEYPQINYTPGNACDTDFPDEYFDYAVAGELIEHLDEPSEFFKEAFRILKPGGKLALTTPLEETEAGEVDGHRHIWSFTKQDIRDLAKPYMKGAIIKETPTWVERRLKYHHPYLIAWITKK